MLLPAWVSLTTKNDPVGVTEEESGESPEGSSFCYSRISLMVKKVGWYNPFRVSPGCH
jgi:hypothetical protein